MAAYITQEELSSQMPLAEIVNACTDKDNQQSAEQVWDNITQAVSDEIDGYLAPRYVRPFPDPLHPKLKTAARWLSLEILYTRRGIYNDQNPATAKADLLRAELKDIGAGKTLLDILSPAPATAPANAPAAATEEMRTKPRNGKLLA